MKLTTPQISTARFHRRSGKGSCYKKLLSSHPKSFNGSKREIIRVTSPCDNSDDSGLGIENNLDYLSNTIVPSVFRFASSQKRSVDESFTLSNKRHRADHKTHNELEDSYAFPIPPITLSNSNSVNCGVSPSGVQNTIPMASKGIRRSMISGKRLVGPPTLSSQLSSASRNGKTQLQILNQPEQQHRARYQTEGSRGAVKDRTGNGFPVVKVTGYNKLTTLQVFIGSDQGRVTPHMFYQACRVTGKNSTPCSEKNINGTIVIEIDIDPTKDMTVTCDCVGILKERNVDVEHRFPEECSTRSKKKSTRCRMVFRTVITSDDGTTETLQIASQPIACTQPPGIPEICKKSLTNCPVIGGKELFILGKNFLKDTHVVFQTEDWEQSVNPDKEFLQQTHLVCTVPTFKSVEIKDPVNAKICVVSGNRTSEPHTFTFTPLNEMLNSTTNTPAIAESSNHGTNSEITSNSDVDNGLNMAKDTQIKTSNSALDDCDTLRPVMLWQGPNLNGTVTKNSNCGMLRQNDSKMMPPPVMLPRRSSVPLIVPDGLATNGKTDAGNASSDEITPLTNAVAVASANQMANNSYVSTSYSNLPDVPIIQDFARTFHSLPDVDHPVMKSEPELKVEPLSEPSVVSCTAESDTQHQQSTTVVRSGIKGALLCTSQSTPNIYLSDESYLYKHTSEMYSTTVSKTEPRSSPTDELTAAFEISTSSAPMMPIDSMSNLMLPTTHATHGYLSSSPMQKTSNVLVSISPPSSSSSSSASSSSSSSSSSSVVIDEQLPDKMSDIMTSLNGSSSFKRESYEFEKLLSPHPSPPQQQQQLQQQLQQQQLQQQHQQQLQQQQQQQQLQQQQQQLQQQQQQLQQQQQQLQQQSLTGCPLKSSVNYENIRNPFCYQNVVSPTIAEANVTNVPIYHQSYMSMEPSNSGMNSSKESMQVSSLSSLYEKQQITDGGSGSANVRVAGTAVTNASKPLSPLAMSIMENSLISDLMKPHQSASQDNNYGAVVPLTKTFTMSKSFLNSQSQDPLVLSDYVPSTLVNNTVSTVPKLEELVNSAADSHMLSERAASLNLLAETTAATNAAAAAAAVASCNPSTTLSLSSFLAERPRNDVLNSVICNTTTAVTTSACDIMAENSMLVPNSSESSATSMYQQCGGDMAELSVAAATVSKQLNLLEMKSTKEEKSVPANVVQVQQMVKKTAEGMFPSEISRMSDRDLLNYINPSCFDEVPRWKNV